MKKALIIVIISIIFGLLAVVAFQEEEVPQDQDLTPVPETTDVRNATYSIDGKRITLTGGVHEAPAAPGSASLLRTTMFGEPVYGDLDEDGDEDAGVLLVFDGGGSGTFYYLAAAVNTDDVYSGTNAILLGDRIAPDTTLIRNGVLIANYAMRQEDEPMSETPSVGVSTYTYLEGDTLEEIDVLEEGETVLEGNLVIGHEVRSFTPCTLNEDLWLVSNTETMQETFDTYYDYYNALEDAEPYMPLFAVMSGSIEDPVTDGFGADYDGTFRIKELIKTLPEGVCF